MLKANGKRIWDRIQRLGNIGGDGCGGVSRLAFSPEDQQATELVMEWMEEAGLEIVRDTVGNVFGRREGKTKAPIVLTGSHLDSVPNGGRFDGVVGVVAALEALQVLRENSIVTTLPLEMGIFVNEEGSRFPGGLMGSMALVGELPADFPYVTRDNDGVLLADAMAKIGLDPSGIGKANRRSERIKAFFELHIEQAQVLEELNKPVGIVSGIAGPHQFKLSIFGETGHAGAIPMHRRKDPLLGAVGIIQKVEKIVNESVTGTRGTVGYIRAFPGGHNIIPRKVEFTLDFRDTDEKTRNRVVEELIYWVNIICKKRGLRYDLRTTAEVPPVVVEQKIIELIKDTAEQLNVPYHIMPSWAAHDAMILSEICPIGMIFVRSRAGLSHCPEEYSTPQDIEKGANVLLHSLLKIAGGELNAGM